MENYYKQGIAVGKPDIRNDAVLFRFRKEVFTLTLFETEKLARLNPATGLYHASVRKLRKLKYG